MFEVWYSRTGSSFQTDDPGRAVQREGNSVYTFVGVWAVNDGQCVEDDADVVLTPHSGGP